VVELVKLHEAPPLTDIPGRLRHLAGLVERGEFGSVVTALIVFDRVDGKLDSICYGDNPSRAEVVGLFTMAAFESAIDNWRDRA
jgi:hypothetical protein